MKKIYFLIIITFLALCFAGTVLDDSFERDGHTRTYRVFIPQNTDAGASLILNLHGYGMSGITMYNMNCDFHYRGDTSHCYVVYPDALINSKAARSWNDGCNDVYIDGVVAYPAVEVDDVGFLSALIDTMCERYQIDTNQVFCSGISDGGWMTFLLAAEIGDRIKKIAPGLAQLAYSTADSLSDASPIPVMMINETESEIVPYYEGLDTVYSIPEAIDILRSLNQCTSAPDSIEMPDIDPNDGFTATCFSYKSDIDNDIFLFRMNGMHHEWPGWSAHFPTPPHGDITATDYIWDFFMNDSFKVKSHIWARSMEIGPKLYMNPGTDSLHIVCDFYNKEGHAFTAYAILENSEGTLIDSFELFDDGVLDDGIAGNNICGGYIGNQTSEDVYSVHVRSHDAETGDKFIMKDQAIFTTAGPIAYTDSVSFTYGEFLPGNNCKYRLIMQNMGAEYTLEDLVISVSSEDTLVELVNALSRSLPDLSPGESAIIEGDLYLKVSADCPLGHELNIDIAITSGGIEYWKDAAQLYVNVIDVPTACSLNQNYPNPFNPQTTISYSISAKATMDRQLPVELAIYDICGRKITTLVDEIQTTGYHTVNWDASGFSSGIYFYRLRAGDFVETKKMVLMK